MKHSRGLCTLALAIIAIASIFFWGCVSDKNSTGTDNATERDINTPAYHEQALKWNTSETRWEFFSWRGTRGADGCEIHINVYNGAGSVPANFNTNAAREALINARDIWTQAIREAGITCESVIKFESEGQTLFTSLPRIDVYFVRQINSGSARSATTVTFHRSTRQFSRVEISIATEYVGNGKTKSMARDDYMSTSAHGFGHAVGIFCFGECQGSPNKNDVMYNPSRYWTLSNGDKATIGFIYQGDAYYKPQGSHGNFEIYVMKPNGSLQTRLTNNPAYDADPDWATMRIK
jgi:hypothetical protein